MWNANFSHMLSSIPNLSLRKFNADLISWLSYVKSLNLSVDSFCEGKILKKFFFGGGGWGAPPPGGGPPPAPGAPAP